MWGRTEGLAISSFSKHLLQSYPLQKEVSHTNINMAPDLNAVAAGGRIDYSQPGASGYDIKQVDLSST